MMKHLLCAFCLALLAGPANADADGPAIWVSDVRGCAPYEGVGGDGGPFLVMTAETAWLDYELFETPIMACRFDRPVSLEPVAGKTEIRAAHCDYRNGHAYDHGVQLTYEGPTRAVLSVTTFPSPLHFELCRLD